MSSQIPQAIATQLQAKAEKDRSQGIKPKFIADKGRASKFSFDFGDHFYDFSKTHLDQELIDIYDELAKSIDLHSKRKSFLAGEKINNTEHRSVLHALLRDSSNQGIEMVNADLLTQARDAETQFSTQYQDICRSLESRDAPIKNIIHVGIGGSSLGTQLLYEALRALGDDREVHFIGNIDAHNLVSVLERCDVTDTLVIGVSKTFTTAETLKNLDSIADWFKANGNTSPLSNFYGVTANPSKAIEYGLTAENVVSFPTWVGGRYSVWSSVSLSAAIMLGKDKFDEFLKGAALMDQHFYQTDFKENLCFIASILDHYYANYMGVSSKAIFAYDYRFRSLVDYLQQLETESNGKDRDRDGDPVSGKTSMVVWGGVGTDVQHSVFQMLHQGTSMIPAEFILVKTPDHDLHDHHAELLANGVAQTAALLAGQDLDTVKLLHKDEGLSEVAMKAKIFSGDRPSLTILIDRLTPSALGSLLAFYEHRVYFGGILSNINSFDQMGVELGKRLAKKVRPLIEDNDADKSDLDMSTQNILSKLHS